MPDIGKAYVQIIPKAEGISGKISSELSGGAASAGDSAGKSIGGSLVSSLKGIIVAAGIGTMIKETLDAGGALQQSFGGLDTLYGDAAEGAKKYAYEAAKAGISANDYAEQAVSFGAALKQAYGGDTAAAMEAANTAILDMTDNAAKMGTPIESIQNAYQGFAKQNYTMLDNLKLGYGGTKSEMERLLADATKLSGVEYNMDNLGDVYEAIHVIQEDLGLTGVAADEAASTFTGSMGAMKAAAENLMANLALGEDISEPLRQLLGNAEAFLVNNLAPMLGNILASLPTLIDDLVSQVSAMLSGATSNMDGLFESGMNIILGLATSIIQNIPILVSDFVNVLMALGEAIMSYDWSSFASTMMESLSSAVKSLASTFASGDSLGIMQGIFSGLAEKFPEVVNKGVEIITNLVNGILSSLPELITMGGTLITEFAAMVMSNAATLISAGADLIINLVNGIVDNLPEIINSAMDVLLQFVGVILDNLPQIIQAGVELIMSLLAGLVKAVPQLLIGLAEICLKIFDAIKEYDWLELGKNILDGIGTGITNSVGNLIDALWGAVDSAISWIKKKLHIESPSKLMADLIGKNMALGIGVGFEDNMPDTEIADTISHTVTMAENAANSGLQTQTVSSNGIDYAALYAAVKAGAEAANLEIDIDGRDLTRTLKGLGVVMA